VHPPETESSHATNHFPAGTPDAVYVTVNDSPGFTVDGVFLVKETPVRLKRPNLGSINIAAITTIAINNKFPFVFAILS